MNSRTRYLPPLMLATALVLSGVTSVSAQPAPQSGMNISQAEVGQLDRFLDTHPDIAQAIAKNPALIDSDTFVASQPAFRAFLQDHPEIRTDLRTNPQVMLRDLVRFDVAEAAATSVRPAARADALNAAEVNRLDSFLDAHAMIAKGLETNPSLIRNRDFLKNNPDLVTFLRNNPDLAKDWRSNPQAAMTALASYDDATTVKTHLGGGSDDALSSVQVNKLDGFLDSHPNIAKALGANPSLINNKDFMRNNPDLVIFLQNHPDLAEDWRSNPQAAMTALASYDAATTVKTHLGGGGSDDALSSVQVNRLDGFLDSHPNIAKALEANPSLINNKDFMRNNPDLVIFLQNHPDLAEDWKSNPQAAMSALATFDAATTVKTHVGDGGSTSLSRAQVTALDGFMDNHPAITKQLEANPALIDDRAYLSDHPELVAFLRDHPDLAQDWRSSPQVAMKDLTMMDAATATKPTPTPVAAPAPKAVDDDITRADVSTFDAFLEDHPAITEQLRAHPTLISESSFISDNPELKAFIASHPAIGAQLRTDPSLFLRDAVIYHDHAASSLKAESNVRRPTGIRK